MSRRLKVSCRRAARMALLCVLPLLGLAGLQPAAAHKPSDAYLTLRVDGSTVQGQWDIALRDLDHAIGLDADGNNEVTWGELRARHAEISAYALARLSIAAAGTTGAASAGEACAVQAGEQLVDEHTDGAYTVLRFSAQCPLPPRELQLGYRLFADIDPQHRGLLRLESGGLSRSAIFAPAAAEQRFALDALSPWAQFAAYFGEGVWHIWIGFDHILFLVSLLLPAVLMWTGKRWEATERFRDAFLDVAKIVTAFTLAHSITLSLAALGWVALPSRLVESAIAASVVLAALNNLWPVIQGRRWIVAFAFGLIHGFGFASVLADLGLPQGSLVLALVGFNVGVEAGQMAIVAALLPLTFLLRRTRTYRWGVFTAGSVAIAVLAAVWLMERAFELSLLSV